MITKIIKTQNFHERYYTLNTKTTTNQMTTYAFSQGHRRYLDGQNATSSTVSSCPWYIPRGPTEGPSVALSLPSPAFLMIDPPDPGDFVAGSVADDVIWSWILHKTTDLSFPAINTPYLEENFHQDKSSPSPYPSNLDMYIRIMNIQQNSRATA